jgi:hypothetical protein
MPLTSQFNYSLKNRKGRAMEQHTDALQIINALQKQNTLLERIAAASERTNELVWAVLSLEQKKAIQDARAERLARSMGKPRQP